jgi:uncharacterized YigZ family protein
MADTYKTIIHPSPGLYKEKGSKFMSFAYPVKSEEEIKNILKNLKKEFHDARHICYAWVLGPDKIKFRANDDGEPSGTGGKPILNQIHNHDLTNILIAVVRYFGGTLLGTAGLALAYRSSAADALSKAQITEANVDVCMQIRFPYELMNAVLTVIKDYRLEPVFRQADNMNIIEIRVPLKQMEGLKKKISSYKQVEIDILNNND